jgi:hypothetical protein
MCGSTRTRHLTVLVTRHQSAISENARAAFWTSSCAGTFTATSANGNILDDGNKSTFVKGASISLTAAGVIGSTARLASSSAVFVTNEKIFTRIPGLTVVVLSEII